MLPEALGIAVAWATHAQISFAPVWLAVWKIGAKSSSSDNSLGSFLAIEPECLSSSGVSRRRARVFSQKICAVTLPRNIR
jgi:hypothetical protein